MGSVMNSTYITNYASSTFGTGIPQARIGTHVRLNCSFVSQTLYVAAADAHLLMPMFISITQTCSSGATAAVASGSTVYNLFVAGDEKEE